ncbi:MAG: PaaI family thioesterase [Candidatus Methylomirabilia bacterium]
MTTRHDPPLPDVFADCFSAFEEQLHPAGTPYHNCFGCAPNHQIGLRVRCFKAEEGVISPIIISKQFEGPPGVAHGGIVAGYLDEILAAAAVYQGGRICLTGELTVRYVRPVPLDTPLLGRGRVAQDRGKYLELGGSLEEYRSRAVLAEARGRFFPIRLPSGP